MDLIDKQALLAEVRDDIRRGCFDQQTVINNIEYAPTVEPKRGEWEGYIHSAYYGVDEEGEPIYKDKVVWYCSDPRCRRKTVIKENFCPSCGADMRGDRDG